MKHSRSPSTNCKFASQRQRPHAAVIEAFEPRLLMATFTVTNTNNSGVGSLRQAITDSNTAAGTDSIQFSIGSGVRTITPASALPTITGTVTIDGTTQPGWASTPIIEINGASAGAGADGLRFTGSGSIIRGIAINRFSDDGVDIEGSGGNFMQLCHIGTDVTGTIDRGNGDAGIEISSSNNFIGYGIFGAPVGNVISGNVGNGVYFLRQNDAAPAVSGNNVVANKIGTNLAGTAALPNDFHGVSIGFFANGNSVGAIGSKNIISGNGFNNVFVGSSNNTVQGNYIGTNNAGTAGLGGMGLDVGFGETNNLIGGTSAGAGNLISGNSNTYGLNVGGDGNTIQGNLIGTNAAGTAKVANVGVGLLVEGNSNVIGGTGAGARNIISGNTTDGIRFDTATGNVVQGNYIGTNIGGTAALSNGGDGVEINDFNNVIGGTAVGARNVISGNASNGVRLTRSSRIEGNYIGTSVTGSGDLGNGAYGVEIVNDNCTVGGTAAGAGNVISGNSDGGVRISGGTSSRVQGNLIGLRSDGTAALPNGIGVLVLSRSNLIGGTVAGARNVISGNSSGVYIFAEAEAGPGLNTVQGNYIGTNAAGTAAVPNTVNGVELEDAKGNTIGGTTASARNVISGNTLSGVYVHTRFSTANGNLIRGNYIGTSASGTAALGNQHGVWFDVGATINEIGGAITGAGNVISGNRAAGIRISDQTNNVQGNFIGTDATGTASLANAEDGIFIEARRNVIGGATAAARNIISGNAQSGIEIFGAGAVENEVYGNYIGTDAAGNNDLGNALNGVLLESNGNIVGNDAGRGNLISGNGRSGIGIFNAAANTIVGNRIGTTADGVSALGNTQWGVGVNGGNANRIGATDEYPNLRNTIAFNTFDGVVVVNASNTIVLGNAIFSNTGLGIDLNDDGVSANDAGDTDGGPNHMQNFPVLTSASTSANATVVSGTLNSTPNAGFTLEFFSTPTADASGCGEGQTYLGATDVLTNTAGNAMFSVVLPIGTAVGSAVSATASSEAGYTSEFSATVNAVLDTTAPVVVDDEFDFVPESPGDAPHQLRYQFSENVSLALSTSDLLLENLTTGQTVAVENMSVEHEDATNTAVFTFPGFAGGVLPNASYRATLLADGITDPAGNALPTNHVSTFFVLAGDADHNGQINFDDYARIDNGFNNGLIGFANGDFNYDGVINFDDYAIIDLAFNNQ